MVFEEFYTLANGVKIPKLVLEHGLFPRIKRHRQSGMRSSAVIVTLIRPRHTKMNMVWAREFVPAAFQGMNYL